MAKKHKKNKKKSINWQEVIVSAVIKIIISIIPDLFEMF